MKHKLINFKFHIFVILLLTTYYLLLTPKARAEGLSLGVFPPLIQITSQTPSAIHEKITLTNFTDSTTLLSIQIKPFTPQGENGHVEYIQKNLSILKYIKVLDSTTPVSTITLSPFQKKDMFIDIKIPEDEPSGDQYFSVVFISKSIYAEQSRSDNVDQKDFSAASNTPLGIATHVLLSINPQTPKARLEEFSAPFYTQKGPVDFSLLVRNIGSRVITPRGFIAITNMFGQTIGTVDILPVNILAQSTRRLPQSTWDERFLLGPYSASVTLVAADQGPVLRKTIYFVAFPYNPILILTIILIMLIFLRSRIKKHLQ